MMSQEPYAVFPCTIQVYVRCGVCQKVAKQEYQVLTGQALPWPQPPEGWRMTAGNLLVCTEHDVRVVVDGQELYHQRAEPIGT